MRARLIFLTPVALAVPTAAYATVYLSTEQAQAAMFSGATFQADDRVLTPEQQAAIAKASGETPLSRTLKAWRVSTGGWFIVDRVVGKHEYITFALGLDADGAVKDIEILEYRESYGDQVRGSAWRAQFKGKRNGAPLRLGSDIKNISGATLSSKHVTDGVRRLLATYAIVLAPHA
jgi:Na+-translocating ferredoxin:NAD+ oxidoreductase RnfG subunit